MGHSCVLGLICAGPEIFPESNYMHSTQALGRLCVQKDHNYTRVRDHNYSPCQSSVHCGNTEIIQHALKVLTVFRDLWRNQVWQWLKEECGKPLLGVWVRCENWPEQAELQEKLWGWTGAAMRKTAAANLIRPQVWADAFSKARERGRRRPSGLCSSFLR